MFRHRIRPWIMIIIGLVMAGSLSVIGSSAAGADVTPIVAVPSPSVIPTSTYGYSANEAEISSARPDSSRDHFVFNVTEPRFPRYDQHDVVTQQQFRPDPRIPSGTKFAGAWLRVFVIRPGLVVVTRLNNALPQRPTWNNLANGFSGLVTYQQLHFGWNWIDVSGNGFTTPGYGLRDQLYDVGDFPTYRIAGESTMLGAPALLVTLLQS